jgi:hypothetical protein
METTTTQTTTTRTEQLNALLARLAGKTQSSPVEFIGRLCEIKRVCRPSKWDRFVVGAQAALPSLTADDVAAIIAYVAA